MKLTHHPIARNGSWQKAVKSMSASGLDGSSSRRRGARTTHYGACGLGHLILQFDDQDLVFVIMRERDYMARGIAPYDIATLAMQYLVVAVLLAMRASISQPDNQAI